MHSSRRNIVALCLSLAFLFFLVNAIARLDQAPGQDELHWYGAGLTLFQEGVARAITNPDGLAVWSPHLLGQLIRASFALFGVSLWVARLPGLLAWVLTGALVFLIIHRQTNDTSLPRGEWAAVGAILCATLPVAAQAPAIIDIDHTVLTPAILLLCACFQQLVRSPHWKWTACCGLAMCLALWCRITTPVIVCPVLLLVAAGASDRTPGSVLRTVLGLGGGTAAFLASWWVYCAATNFPFSGPFEYTWQILLVCATGARKATGMHLLLTTVYLLLWVGPLLGLLVLTLAGRRILDVVRRKQLSSADTYLLVGLAVVLGYSVVGGALFGFPKYQAPAIPLLCVASIVGISRWESAFPRPTAWRRLGIVFCLSVGIQWFLCGDLLYDLRYTLRFAQAFQSGTLGAIGRGLLLRVLATSAGFAIAGLCAIDWKRPRNCLPVLLAMALGANTAATLRQTTAGYHTGYLYGDPQSVRAVVNFLEDKVADSRRIVAPGEIIHLLERPSCPHVPNDFWTDRAAILEFLNHPSSGALVLSPLTNPVTVVRNISEDSDIQSALQDNYLGIPIGSFTVYLRRSTPPCINSCRKKKGQSPS